MTILSPAEFNAASERDEWHQICDATLAFEHADFAAILALWKAQAGERAMPARTDMTARVLKDFLPRVAMKERVAVDPSRYLWRLCGTKVAEVLGEQTGKFTDEGVLPKQTARWNASCDVVLATKKPLRFVGLALVENKEYLASDLLFMPLSCAKGEARFIMGFGHFNVLQLRNAGDQAAA